MTRQKFLTRIQKGVKYDDYFLLYILLIYFKKYFENFIYHKRKDVKLKIKSL